MTLKINGGSMEVSKIADIGEDLHSIWFSEKAIANIMSLKDAIALYRVTTTAVTRCSLFIEKTSQTRHVV